MTWSREICVIPHFISVVRNGHHFHLELGWGFKPKPSNLKQSLVTSTPSSHFDQDNNKFSEVFFNLKTISESPLVVNLLLACYLLNAMFLLCIRRKILVTPPRLRFFQTRCQSYKIHNTVKFQKWLFSNKLNCLAIRKK